MNITKGLIIFSLLFNLIVVMLTIFSEPAATQEFANYGLPEYIQALSVIVPIILISCWPWIAGFIGASDPAKKYSLSIFSILSIAGCSLLFLPSYTGPVEGIAYSVALLIVALWVVYPTCSLIKVPASES